MAIVTAAIILAAACMIQGEFAYDFRSNVPLFLQRQQAQAASRLLDFTEPCGAEGLCYESKGYTDCPDGWSRSTNRLGYCNAGEFCCNENPIELCDADRGMCYARSDYSECPEGSTRSVMRLAYCSSEHFCCVTPRKCDVSALEKSFARVIGGVDANVCEFPYMVSLEAPLADPDNPSSFCSGVLVTENKIVTAAHCVTGFTANPTEDITVVVGEHDTTAVDDSESRLPISSFEIHPGYNPETLENDIAVVTLSSSVAFSECVLPACMATDLTDVDTSDCFIAGWGTTSIETFGVPSAILQNAAVTLVDNSECELAPSSPIHCVEADGADGCVGDDGGPLMCRNADGIAQLVGVQSAGYNCETEARPTFFIDSTADTFIEDNL